MTDIITLIFTGTIAISTVFYTIYSQKLWKETHANTLMTKFVLMLNYIQIMEEKSKEVKNVNEMGYKFMTELTNLITKFGFQSFMDEIDKNSEAYKNFTKDFKDLFKNYGADINDIPIFKSIFGDI